MTPPPESWFDRLASKPFTRRQGMRAAAMGAAATVGASLPFARPLPTASADENDCRKGCVYVANQTYSSKLTQKGVEGFQAVTKLPLIGPAGPITGLFLVRKLMRDYDRIVGNHRIEVENCFVPGCNGFDPKANNGPCSGCESPLFCNPCTVLDEGYICCVYGPKDCHGDCCPTTVPPGCP
jgi:hypothetical protein